MKKKINLIISTLLALVVLMGVLVGCSNESTTTTTTSTTVTTPAPTTRTITDFEGNTVTIPTPEKLQRVAVLTSPPNIITFVIGVNDKLCATSKPIQRSTFLKIIYPRLEEIPPVRAGAGKINIEALLQTDPQLCLGSDMDLQPVDKATRIPTLRCIETTAIAYPDQQKKEVRFFGDVFGRSAQAEKYCSYIDNNVATINKALSGLSDADKKVVYVGFNADHLTTFGSDTFMDEWIQAAGCNNAAHPVSTIGGAEGGLASISMEQVLSWNPDIMIIDTGTPEDVYNDPVWANIPAIKNKQVYILPRGMFGWNRASTEPAALFPMWLALTVYPDRFPDNTVIDELKKFYHEIINYDLTESDISLILTGK